MRYGLSGSRISDGGTDLEWSGKEKGYVRMADTAAHLLTNEDMKAHTTWAPMPMSRRLASADGEHDLPPEKQG
jgi:hypothetical protein